MQKAKIKTVNKEKRRKKTGTNIQSANLQQTYEEPCSRDKSICDAHISGHQTHVGMDINFASIMKNLVNNDMFKENNSCNQELHHLQEKVAELVSQRDDLIRFYQMVSEYEEKISSKGTNIQSLEAEIFQLKSIVGMLQKGLVAVLDEHSTLRKFVLNQLTDVDKLLEKNINKVIAKKPDYSTEIPEKYKCPIHQEQGDFSHPNYLNSEKSFYDICKNPSIFNSPNINLFTTLNTKISNIFEPGEGDSIVKFRQLAELKIIIEILQKYSKIVTDELKNINTSAEHTNKNSVNINLKSKFKTNQNIPVNHHLECAIPGPENALVSTCCIHPLYSTTDCIVSNMKARFESPKEDLSMSIKNCDRDVNEERSEMSSNILKSHPSLENIFFNSKGIDEDINSSNSLAINGRQIKQTFFKKENYWNIDNNKQIFKKSMGFRHTDKKFKKRKVLFLSDGHGRCCSNFLQEELGPDFSVISVIKPDALFKEIIDDFMHLASSYSREDYVIIFAGSNNMKFKNRSKNHIDLEMVLPILKHTNVIFTRIPLIFDNPSLNPEIRRVNSENFRKIFQLSRENSNIILMPRFTFFSRDPPRENFNKMGKKTFCKFLAKTIIANSFKRVKKSGAKSQTSKTLTPPKSLEDASCETINYVNDIKNPAELINSEDVRYEIKINGDNVIIQEINKKCELHELEETNKITAQTQTSVGDLSELPCHPTKEKFHDPVQLKEYNNNSNSQSQSTKVDQQTNDNLKGFCEDQHSENPKDQGLFAGIFMKNNQTNMTTIKELLGQGDIPKPKKNFIQENVKKLKELKLEKANKFSSQRSKNTQPLTERQNTQTIVSSSRYSQRPARPQNLSNMSPTLRSRRTIKHGTDNQPVIVEVNEDPRGFRSQGCQTLNGKQLERLYDEGVVRFASVRDLPAADKEEIRTRKVKEMALQTEAEDVQVLHPPPSSPSPPPASNDGLHWDEEKKDKDYVKINATVSEPRHHRTAEQSSADPTRPPPTYQRGVVPKYLREHKKEMEKERMMKAREDDCPEGHIQLPDEIRKKHLNTLRQNYTDLVSQLNQLPVSTDTLRTRTRKKQIETDLDRIEAAIALFSREKVFVKADS